MLDSIIAKIRALIEDFSGSSYEVFEYTTTNIFTVAQTNIAITAVLINGETTTDYTFDSTTNKITITASGLSSGDKCEVDYTYYNYSDTELKEWIRAALVWVSIYSYDEGDYELETDGIYPTPSNETTDLIALVASILIKPDHKEKSLPNLTVKYPRTMTKEEVIQKLISRFNRGVGTVDYLELE